MTIFYVLILAISGRLVLPVQVSHIEHQRLKIKNCGPDHQKMKIQTNRSPAKIKTVRTSASLELKKSSLYLPNFYVVVLGHDKFTDASKAITFRPRFEAPLVSPHFRVIIPLKILHPSVEKKIE